MTTFLVLEVRFFQGVRFLGGPFFSGPGSGSGSSFETMHKTSKTGCTHYIDGCFRAFQIVIPVIYLSVTTGSHLILEKENYLSKGKWEGT